MANGDFVFDPWQGMRASLPQSPELLQVRPHSSKRVLKAQISMLLSVECFASTTMASVRR